MSLWVPGGCDFEWMLIGTTGRPNAAWGTTITSNASANTMGTYAQLVAGASVTEDVAAIRININSNSGATGTNRAMLVTIGIDPAGGTTYTDFITYLSGGGADTYAIGAGGHNYYFPVRIPAGSSIAAKCQCAVGSITCRVNIQLFACPRNPGLTRVGSYVTTFGAQTASSNGSTVTAGTTSEGTWTQIGSALAEPLWYWQLGYGYNGTAQVAAAWLFDLGSGDATNKRVIVSDWHVVTTSAESTHAKGAERMCMEEVKNGDILYARGQCSGTPAATVGILVYGVGG